MRIYWIRVSPIPVGVSLSSIGMEKTQGAREESTVKTEAEIGAMHLHSKECQGLSPTMRSEEKHSFQKEPTCQHLDLGLPASRTLFHPPSLWSLVSATLGKLTVLSLGRQIFVEVSIINQFNLTQGLIEENT